MNFFRCFRRLAGLGALVLAGSAAFGQAAAPEGTEGWYRFADPTLDSLIRLVPANPELTAALSRIDEARLRIRIAESYLAPSIRANPLVQTQSLAANRPVPFPVDAPRVQLNTFQLPLDLNYEIDFFRRIRQTVRFNELQAQISEADYRLIRLAVVAELARVYFLVRANDAERFVIRRNLASRDSVLAIIRERFRAGLTTEIDVRRSETDIGTIRVQYVNLERGRAEFVNALAALAGQNPAGFTLPERLPGRVPAPPFESIPDASLRRRPDLQQATLQTDAAETNVAIARALLLPRISLIGSVGFLSGKIDRWILPGSGTYTVGAGASIPISEGRRNRTNVTLAQQQVRTAEAGYQQRLLVARREAETALDNLEGTRRQREEIERVRDTANQTERLTRELYVKGLTTYLDVLDAQRSVLDAERQQAQLLGQQFIYTVALLKALGGEW
jgi:multidrug efflux system outer membrane protein